MEKIKKNGGIDLVEPVDPIEVYITENIKTFDDLKGQKRLKEEKFEDYKIRRKAENLVTKIYLKGRFTHEDGKNID